MDHSYKIAIVNPNAVRILFVKASGALHILLKCYIEHVFCLRIAGFIHTINIYLYTHTKNGMKKNAICKKNGSNINIKVNIFYLFIKIMDSK